jgi:hypothetical protein
MSQTRGACESLPTASRPLRTPSSPCRPVRRGSRPRLPLVPLARRSDRLPCERTICSSVPLTSHVRSQHIREQAACHDPISPSDHPRGGNLAPHLARRVGNGGSARSGRCDRGRARLDWRDPAIPDATARLGRQEAILRPYPGAFLGLLDVKARAIMVLWPQESRWLEIHTFADETDARIEPFEQVAFDLTSWWAGVGSTRIAAARRFAAPMAVANVQAQG